MQPVGFRPGRRGMEHPRWERGLYGSVKHRAGNPARQAPEQQVLDQRAHDEYLESQKQLRNIFLRSMTLGTHLATRQIKLDDGGVGCKRNSDSSVKCRARRINNKRIQWLLIAESADLFPSTGI